MCHNIKCPSGHMKKKEKKSEIHFNNIFSLTRYSKKMLLQHILRRKSTNEIHHILSVFLSLPSLR